MHDTALINYQITGDSLELVQKYRKLISRYARLCKANSDVKKDSQHKWFYGLFLEGRPKTQTNLETVRSCISGAMFLFTTGDCYNQTVQYFLQLAGDFVPSEKKYTSFSQYIRMVLGWRLKYWVLKHVKTYRNRTSKGELVDPDYYTSGHSVPDIEPFTMNIKWILSGSKSPAFKNLKPYDRYLLYLYYAEGHTIEQIGKLICKSKNTINKDIRRIISLCKEDAISEG